MLSFLSHNKNSKPFAKIAGGKFKGKKAYVNEDSDQGKNELVVPE